MSLWFHLSALLTLAVPTPPPLAVEAWRAESDILRDGVKAFSNRNYTFEGIPAELVGWRFTRLAGGARARLRVTPAADGSIVIATGARAAEFDLTGWQPLPGVGFHYTAGGRTPVELFHRPARAGEVVVIPDGNFTGGIVLAPELTLTLRPPTPDLTGVPGVVIAHQPAYTGRYIGSPSLALLPDGGLVASHDFFGPEARGAASPIYRSADGGMTWRQIAEVPDAYWSNLFWHRDALYLLGTSNDHSRVMIHRSTDGGATWRSSAILTGGGYHTAPCPVLVHQGRLWRAMEDTRAGGGWPRQFRAFLMSAPEAADLLDPESWTATAPLASDPAWLEGFRGWLEGNAVALPDGEVVNVLRVDHPRGGRAAVTRLSADGRALTFDPTTGFIDFPGAVKFTIRRDPLDGIYWSLVSVVEEPWRARGAGSVRNTLALVRSTDGLTWTRRATVLAHPDALEHGFQYLDWQFAGEDLLAVSRTAFDDGLGGANNFHDANLLTFHRVRGFRTLTDAPRPGTD